MLHLTSANLHEHTYIRTHIVRGLMICSGKFALVKRCKAALNRSTGTLFGVMCSDYSKCLSGGKDYIKCTLQTDHRNGECPGWENSRHAPRPRAKTTLNVLYRMTTEMGECRGWENSTGMPTLAKMTLNVLYRLTTEIGEERGWAQKGIKLIYCPWGGGGIWIILALPKSG